MKNTEKTQAYFEAMGKQINQGFRFTEGQLEAYWTWFYSRSKEEIVEDGHLWSRDVHDFIKTFREAGVESFVTIDRSTGLMENLHGFAAEGCAIDTLCIIKATNEYDYDKQGIRIKIK